MFSYGPALYYKTFGLIMDKTAGILDIYLLFIIWRALQEKQKNSSMFASQHSLISK